MLTRCIAALFARVIAVSGFLSIACFVSACGPGPITRPLPGSGTPTGGPAGESSDSVERMEKPSTNRGPRWPRAGKPVLCEQRIPETSGRLQREVERAIDRRGIRDCSRRFKSTEPVVELSFTVAEDGRIVIPHAKGVDYMLAACIERVVEDACVGMIVDERGEPIAVPFTMTLYLTE